ncbi:MAG: CBS domain-containing protein [Spirochaeta sp.]|jgi:CBS domain-containing protein|nr:CBS domain-containing protein [Spirochaeta sp.]
MTQPSQIPIDTDQASPIITELIYRLKVRDVMTTKLHTESSDASMRAAQQIMKANGITGVPVVEGNRLIGIVSMDDVIRALDEGHIDAPIQEYMTRSVIVLEDDMPLSFGISYLDKYHYGRFPVLNAGKELVGIITSRDIIIALLLEINKEVQRYESHIAQPETSGRGFRLEYTTRKFDFETAGRLSTETKKQLKLRNLPPKFMRRVAVACYELEMNQVVHSVGGSVRVTFDPTTATVEIVANDNGPGIEDVEQALIEGYSTATEWIRSLGFGAGMGLPNTQRVTDEFEIESTTTGPRPGTAVRAKIHIPEEDHEST